MIASNDNNYNFPKTLQYVRAWKKKSVAGCIKSSGALTRWNSANKVYRQPSSSFWQWDSKPVLPTLSEGIISRTQPADNASTWNVPYSRRGHFERKSEKTICLILQILMWCHLLGRNRSGVGVWVDIIRPESESESESIKNYWLCSPVYLNCHRCKCTQWHCHNSPFTLWTFPSRIKTIHGRMQQACFHTLLF